MMTRCSPCCSEMVSDHSSAVSFTAPLASAKALKWEVRPWRESRRAQGHVGSSLGCADGTEALCPGGRELGTLFSPLHVSPVPLLAAVALENPALPLEWPRIPGSDEKDLVTRDRATCLLPLLYLREEAPELWSHRAPGLRYAVCALRALLVERHPDVSSQRVCIF